MKFTEIFKSTDHRPYTIPKKPWIMKQVWRDLLFMHWEVNKDSLLEKIPKSIELDLFEGKAWLGIVPFRMEGIRPRFMPAVPWLSAFPELNVRAYVIKNGKPGVWFFSLDALNPLAVEIARKFFYLPYFNAKMICEKEDNKISYISERKDDRGKEAKLEMNYEPTSQVYYAKKGSLEHWLTERYCLYSEDKKKNLYRGEIHHLPWSLQTAQANIQTNTMGLCHDIILPNQAPILHFVDKLEVGIYALERI